MLVTFPDHDITTHYLFKWGESSVGVAEGHGIQVTRLDGPKATKRNLESYLSKFQFNMVFLNGHGEDTIVMGHDNEPILIAGKNEEKLKQTITYAISCSSAKELGDNAIKSGALCYIGYDQDFMFTLDENHSTRPLEDKLAAMFLHHTNVFMNALVKGSSVAEAYEKAKSSLWESITVAESSGSWDILSWLLWDYYAFVAKGNLGSKLA